MMNKDFLRDVLAERKKLLKLQDVKLISVPKYEELSVKNLFPHLKNDPNFMMYLPDKYPKGHPPDREYFFNVLNTLNPEYMSSVIKHASRLRNHVVQDEQQRDSIEISEEWWNQLQEIPFVSCKYIWMSWLY